MTRAEQFAAELTPVKAMIAEKIRTGITSLDRFAIRYRIAHWAVAVFDGPAAWDLRIPRALMSLCWKESRGRPPYVGDALLPGGPSIGPMQVYRRTAKDLKLWTPPKGLSDSQERDLYLQLATDEDLGIHWGVLVFQQKLKEAKGDVGNAIRRYNGSGPAAEKYRDEVLAFATKLWGDIVTPPPPPSLEKPTPPKE